MLRISRGCKVPKLIYMIVRMSPIKTRVIIRDFTAPKNEKRFLVMKNLSETID